MTRHAAMLGGITLGLCGAIFGQTVTFNSPTQWMTARSGDVAVKVLIDTAKVKKNPVEFALYRIQNGAKKKIAAKTVKAGDYAQEFTVATLADKVVGGRDYLKIEWTVAKTKERGVTDPFGLVKLDTAKTDTSAVGHKVAGELTIAAAKALIGDAGMKSAGKLSFGVVWNDKALGLFYTRGAAGQLTFCFDGKNAKNAFLSYSDRVITCNTATDSIKALRFKRSASDTGIVYSQEAWLNEIKTLTSPEASLVMIPWYDLGMVPLDNRMIGWAAFAGDSSGRATASLPAQARKEVPGTWGNLVLVDGAKAK